jgi:hypothetical protein
VKDVFEKVSEEAAFPANRTTSASCRGDRLTASTEEGVAAAEALRDAEDLTSTSSHRRRFSRSDDRGILPLSSQIGVSLGALDATVPVEEAGGKQPRPAGPTRKATDAAPRRTRRKRT